MAEQEFVDASIQNSSDTFVSVDPYLLVVETAHTRLFALLVWQSRKMAYNNIAQSFRCFPLFSEPLLVYSRVPDYIEQRPWI